MVVFCRHLNQLLSSMLGTCKPLPAEQVSSGFCLHRLRGRQPQAASWFPAGCLRLEAARCVSITSLQLVRHSSRKKK